MRVVIQRVSQASVSVPDESYDAQISQGFVVLLGIEDADDRTDIEWLVRKITNLRVFSDEAGKMNRSIGDIEGQVLLVSQFTLHASTKKGNRPSFIKAARPDKAIPLYETFGDELRSAGIKVETGIFGADMKITLINDGPVTIIIDSKIKE